VSHDLSLVHGRREEGLKEGLPGPAAAAGRQRPIAWVEAEAEQSVTEGGCLRPACVYCDDLTRSTTQTMRTDKLTWQLLLPSVEP
jgi:hypothetical protein